ncbi:MAG: hypothetical protein IJS45_09105 [Clostridia bacterium]|nr:hypothetical protein [Clostridia bacterium]
MKKLLLLAAVLAAVLLVLVSCSGNGAESDTETETSSEPDVTASGEIAIDDVDFSSYVKADGNERVFYEIFVGSFSDSDGDGVGDLRGIINRMDYLNDGDDTSGKSLGVEGLWLTPIFKSSTYHKYNVNDYYTVDPKFGTNDDLKELVDLCHERNVKVILDLPINHTGTGCEWYGQFVKAHRQGDTSDPYYDYYCFYTKGDEVPAGRSFAQVSGTEDYYECNFDNAMPELNFDNEDVRREVVDIARYYMVDVGVDGFRFDAAKYIYYGDNAKCVEFWKWYISELKSISPDVYTVAEVWDGDGITDLYYPALNCFNFTTSQVSGLIADTAKAGDVNKYTAYVQRYVEKVKSLNEDAMMIPFVSNHDMDRAAGFLTVASGQMAMAANIYILNTGSPFIYYGEELGMRGSRGGAQTDANRRLAMIWGDGDTIKDPEGATYPASSQTDQTAEKQKADATSLYTRYKELIMVRKANPEIAKGEYKALSFTGMKLGGFISTYEGSSVCVIHNTSGSSVTVDLSGVTSEQFKAIAAVVGEEDAKLEGTTLTVGGRTSVVLR